MRKIIVFSLAILSLPAWAALQENRASFTSFEMLNPIVAESLPSAELKKGAVDIKLVPAFLSYREDEQTSGGHTFQELDGTGGGLAVTYSLTDRWGISVMAMGFNADGTGVVQDTVTGEFGENRAEGVGGTVMGIYDLWGEEYFRLPVLFGVGYFALKQEAEIADATSTLKSERELNSAAITVGMAAQWLATKWLQISPFFMVAQPLSDSTDTCTATGAATCPTKETVSKDVGTLGVEIRYLPLGLGASFVPQIGNASAVALKLEFRF